MSADQEIDRISQAKSDIKAAIERKGVTVGNGRIDTYAQKIDQITGGGGYPEPTGTIEITENGEGINVKDYATANVDINYPEPTGTIYITENGEDIDVKDYATANVNVSGGGSDINNTKMVEVIAQNDIEANTFVGGNTQMQVPSSQPIPVPEAYANFYDNGGVVTEEKMACAVIWLNENFFLTVAKSYTGTGKQNLVVKKFSSYVDPNTGGYNVTQKDTYSLNWYPEHFDTVTATGNSPVIYPIDPLHFCISYPSTVVENGVTYNGAFETFEINESNKTVSVIDIFDIGAPKQVVPISNTGVWKLIFPKNGVLYSREFFLSTGSVTWRETEFDTQVLDLSDYSDIQSADSYDVDIFSAGCGMDGTYVFVTAKVTTTPATNNYICSTISQYGELRWSGRTTVTSFTDHIPYQFACSAPWDSPNVIVIGQKDASTFLTLQFNDQYDYANAQFVDVQMRNASNGYIYRGALYGNQPYYVGNATSDYGAFCVDDQADYSFSGTYQTYTMFPSEFGGKSYELGANPIYNFYNINAQQSNQTPAVVIAKAYVDPQTSVIGEEASRYFMTVMGVSNQMFVYPASEGSASIYGVSRESAQTGDLVQVEVQA